MTAPTAEASRAHSPAAAHALAEARKTRAAAPAAATDDDDDDGIFREHGSATNRRTGRGRQ